jgi:hypothetical protein
MHADKAYFTQGCLSLSSHLKILNWTLGTWAVGAKVTSQKRTMLCSVDRFQLQMQNMAVLASMKSSVMNATRQ